jgi:hypothetical protein
MKTCKLCSLEHHAKGLCRVHYWHEKNKEPKRQAYRKKWQEEHWELHLKHTRDWYLMNRRFSTKMLRDLAWK